VRKKTNEFRAWMDARGLKTKAVAADLQVDEATIRNWRSQGVPPRRLPHVKKYMAEWRESNAALPVISDEAVTAFAATHQNLVLHPTEQQFDAWSEAALAAKKTLKAWAIQGLGKMAGLDEERGNGTDGKK
jgi:hypothetical protein